MLEDLLTQKKTAILNRWLELTLGTYSPETQTFLGSRTNKFANPVGFAISEGLEGLLEGLLKRKDSEDPEFSTFLDRIIRVRAIQEFSPANAVAFVFTLKTVVREALAKDIQENRLFEELLTFESRIDRLALLSFNIYMQCRETLFEIRATEIRNRTSRILERACKKYGNLGEWSGLKENETNSVT